MTIHIVAPDGRAHTFELDPTLNVLDAGRAAANHFELPGPAAWTLARGPRSLAGVLSLEAAGAQDGERLDLRRW
jgi:hypothetical protein